jgi:hypothetical protein
VLLFLLSIFTLNAHEWPGLVGDGKGHMTDAVRIVDDVVIAYVMEELLREIA